MESDIGLKRLAELDFIVSKSQPKTPRDGNCMFHCISDQTHFSSHSEVRNAVVSNIYVMIEKDIIFWDESEFISDWIETMKLEGTFGDHYSLQVIANLLERDIIIIPSKAESAHILNKYCIVKANVLSNITPVYMLWYEETVHGVGHYQSIEPIQVNVVTRHYNWSLKNKDSRIDQSEVRARLPSNARTVESVSSIADPDIHSS